MVISLLNKLSRIKRRVKNLLDEDLKETYSQFGEDSILGSLFDNLRVSHPIYLDIGAHHPRHLSNTFLLYKNGSRGVLIEPDPLLYFSLKRVRPLDTILNVGIGIDPSVDKADFFIYEGHAKGLNTLSSDRVKEVSKYTNVPQPKVIQISLKNINEVIESHFTSEIDLLSIDVEGMDLQILHTLDFSKYAPKVFCVEISKTSDEGRVYHNEELVAFILSKGYIEYANTFINGIYVRRDLDDQSRSNWY